MGLTQYIGRPCKRGHDPHRFLCNSKCVACCKEASAVYKKTPKGRGAMAQAISRHKKSPLGKMGTRKYRLNIKVEVIAHYGGKCACCGEAELSVLCIDHINGGGNKHRKEIGVGSGYRFHRWLRDQGYPEGFQVLCANCNLSKHLLGACHHQRVVTQVTGLNEL